MAKKFIQLLNSLFTVVLSDNEKCVLSLRSNELFGRSDSLACMYLAAVYLAR